MNVVHMFSYRADERRKMHFMPGNENPYVTIPSSVVRTAGLHWNSRGMVMANQQYIPKDGPGWLRIYLECFKDNIPAGVLSP